jgi:hypothetical protein
MKKLIATLALTLGLLSTTLAPALADPADPTPAPNPCAPYDPADPAYDPACAPLPAPTPPADPADPADPTCDTDPAGTPVADPAQVADPAATAEVQRLQRVADRQAAMIQRLRAKVRSLR